jgi:hypothetical protein
MEPWQLDPMTASEAAEYGPQWGSYMTAGDPGYIMYTAIPPERPEHRDTMVSWLEDRCLPLAREGCDEEGDEYEWSGVEMIKRMCAYLRSLEYPETEEQEA